MEEAFDRRYSESVSLSRILDYFLLTDENPNTVVEFMATHSDRTEEILGFSDCCLKMFQHDFLKRVDSSNVEKFFDVVKRTKADMVLPMCSQVFYRKDDFDEVTVDRCMRMLRVAAASNGTRHRYGGMNGKYGRSLDVSFLLGKDATYVAENMPTDFFSKMCAYLENSIFEGRILQKDFYEALSPINRRVLIQNLSRGTRLYVVKFIRQLMTYELDINEKYELFRVVKNGKIWLYRTDLMDVATKDAMDEIMKSSSYAEFSIRSTVTGLGESKELLLDMLFLTDLRVLFEMLDEDRKKLDGICQISELLDCLKNSMYNSRNPTPRFPR